MGFRGYFSTLHKPFEKKVSSSLVKVLKLKSDPNALKDFERIKAQISPNIAIGVHFAGVNVDAMYPQNLDAMTLPPEVGRSITITVDAAMADTSKNPGIVAVIERKIKETNAQKERDAKVS